MCGFAGLFANRRQLLPLDEIVERMAEAIPHRGPDDKGVWLDDTGCLALGHRRLSILDLSYAGHQPMFSCHDKLVIAFNGQIYNHLALRTRLEQQSQAPSWRGHCDTETLLACFHAWGVEQTLQSATGMFALALWNRADKVLTLARDRLGEKPLYYGWQHGAFMFASELKAFKRHPAWDAEIDRDSLALFLRHNCVPAPYSIYKNIAKLMPGHFLTLPLKDLEQGVAPASRAYWSLNDVVRRGLENPFSGTIEDAVDTLEMQLSESVRSQMLADVPIGAFLSGGIDSSLIAALMQTHSNTPIKTFTIGFDEQDYNEARHASAVAHHIGSQHTELYISPRDALNIIPSLSHIYCEPQSANSQIPAVLVSRLAGQYVKVTLTGDGGDELFGGYNRYLLAYQTWIRTQRLPLPLRRVLSASLRLLPPRMWDRLFHHAQHILPSRMHIATPGNHAHKLASVLALDTGEAFYKHLVSHWPAPASIVKGATEPPTLLTDRSRWPETDSMEHWMMAMDAQTYLPDEVLAKVDRAAMASSLETRVPMLNHHVVELAWRMPLDYKIRNGEGKWLLREVLHRHVPKGLMERPKMGFGIPLGDWLRGPLRDWAEDLIDEGRLNSEGYFHPKPIRALWSEHLKGKSNGQYALWDVLMFQAWLANEKA
ncbi:asparagine synthase (glutamine-hydrolyzing) [Allopusillimonas ginsengisoli]|uniref:asparagine synthase (glutamine-hydrolyzing) n=1 Tax=Allopusillimonas ginsengisoli TaxID=453575 RepID=UPI00101EAE28|nr:asparagine synthase (glutamine-hydrolyzing) [Allopusillimonas ginsengisoli]TEA78622.1 asparagine synthase (glutamine-hydrolyzing) [Allopusillimonas ginsengisoli]